MTVKIHEKASHKKHEPVPSEKKPDDAKKPGTHKAEPPDGEVPTPGPSPAKTGTSASEPLGAAAAAKEAPTPEVKPRVIAPKGSSASE